DWSFQAELYLFRGPGASPEDRLDFVLRKKAAEGVHIYIMLWWGASIATGGSVNSAHVQDVFAADSGITVLRHPTNNVVFKWSHHQKIVVID
ncbi:hypothetical protein, partial [Vibrio cholerae]|uniref:hypothetical protein n=1 Tax=Vibrio cholerae TaxID=666 RepID=UPI001F2629D9